MLGAEVAARLKYQLGDSIILAHGASDVSFARHGDKPFWIVGVLKRTGTPVDQTVHVSLQAIEAIHIDWQGGAPISGLSISASQARNMDLTPKAITAALIGLKSKIATFQVQRYINDYSTEALTAILPGVALSQLWDLIGLAENALLIVSILVVLVGFSGMLTALLTSLNERRREMAILRSVGARPIHIFGLIIGEAGFITLLGTVFGVSFLYVLLFFGQPIITSYFGIFIAINSLSGREWLLLSSIVIAGFLVGIIPSYRAYRLSLADGLSIQV